MKKLLLLAVAAVVLWFGGSALWRALGSDETKIRRLLTEAAEAFNARSTGGVLDGFADGYRDATTGTDREALRGALLYVLLRARDGVRYRVELDDESLRVTLDEEAGTCTASFTLALSLARADGRSQPLWELAVDADLAKRDGWQIVASRHRTLSGSPPQ